ncbi:fibronectin type III domain-containing protein [Kitasatospora sp. NPDC048239]|uniref:fibronectin type III domain-containing protein n=1 Tax=Kitasatospora sp. NPDC048239 TaxID=3364046 RepID=UPI003721EC7F
MHRPAGALLGALLLIAGLAEAAPAAAHGSTPPAAERTEVVALRTETSQTFANRDGTYTYESTVRPRWTRQGGGWAPVDSTLRRTASGTYAPVAVPSRLELSGGGKGPLAVLTTEDGRRLALSWPAELPVPVAQGAALTYPDVLPSGVDLRVAASPTGGFEEVLVVKNAEAAADPALSGLRLAVEVGEGLTLGARDGGTVAVADAHGRVAFDSPPALMWDSSTAAGPRTAPASARASGVREGQDGPQDVSTADRPGRSARVAPVATTVVDGAIAVQPDQRLLTGAETVYPVYIDPAFEPHPASAATQGYAEVKEEYPNGAYYNSPPGAGLAIGYNGWAAPYGRHRVYYQLGLPANIAGSHVLGADLVATQVFAPSTGAQATAELWQSGSIGSSTTWINQPAVSGPVSSRAYTTVGSNGSSSISLDATQPVAAAVLGGQSSVTLGLRQQGESDKLRYTRFAPDPVLTIRYDTAPRTPTGFTVTPGTTVGAAVYSTDSRPAFTATATDPDGDQVQLEFQVLAGSTVVASGTSGAVASGSPGSWTPSTALADAAYTWQARAFDGQDRGAWSAAQSLTVDTTAPPAPTVAAAAYPAGAWTAPAAGPVAFDLTAPAGASGLQYGLDAPASVPAATGPVQLNPAAGWHSLNVVALDAAGNRSSTAAYSFGVGAAAVTAPANGASGDGGAVALGATSAPGLTGVRYQYRLGTTGTFTDLPVGDVTAGGAAIAAWPVSTAPNGAAPGLSWNAARTVTGGGAVQLRAVFTDPSGRTATSTPVGYTVVLPLPGGAPVGVTAAGRDGGARIGWTAPAGGGFTGYRVTVTGGLTGGGSVVGVPLALPADATTATVTGLVNGTGYTVTVAATNANGAGPGASATVTPQAAVAPGAVTALAVTPGVGQLAVSWTAPAADGGSDLAATVVEIHAAAGDALLGTQTVPAPGGTATVGQLPSGAVVYAVVRARNAAGLTGPAVRSGNVGLVTGLGVTALGAWRTTDPGSGAPMVCLIWHFAGLHPETVSGRLHYQAAPVAGGAPDAATDWSVDFTPEGNYSGAGGEYSWCADTDQLPLSPAGTRWTPVALTADDAHGNQLSATAAGLAGLSVVDPDGVTDPPTFVIGAQGKAAAVRSAGRPAKVWHLVGRELVGSA